MFEHLPVITNTETLIRQLGGPRKSVRRQAERELVKLGKPAVPALIKTLEKPRDPDLWRQRWRAADALGQIGDKRAISPLVGVLFDHLPVRLRAAEVLGSFGELVVGLLSRFLKTSFVPKEELIIALGETRSDKAVDPLIRCLGDNDPWVRQRAIDALKRINDERAIEPLIGLFDDKDPFVRWAASCAIGRIGGRRIISSSV